MFKGLKHEISAFFSDAKKHFPGNTKLQNFGMFLNYAGSRVAHGANEKDFFAYKFYEKSGKQKKSFMTERRLAKLASVANGGADVWILKDKTRTNELFSEYLGREWLDMDKTDINEFVEFCKRHDMLFCKAKSLRAGRGIWTETASEYDDINVLYEKLRNEHVLCEERIVQGGILEKLNPETVNTVRLATVLCDDTVYFVAAALRIGVGETCTDHMARGGIHAVIDMDTGIVSSPASNYSGIKYEVHPKSGEKITGLQLPYWDEMKAVIDKAARRIPDIHYVGWDIALCEGGRICIIEANSFSGGTSLQLPDQVGKWDRFLPFVNRLKRRKTKNA